jgi:hypothetical protein
MQMRYQLRHSPIALMGNDVNISQKVSRVRNRGSVPGAVSRHTL